MRHYLVIDLESWVYPDSPRFRNLDSAARKRLDNGYIVDSTKRLLDLLDRLGQKLTFFILGELYSWYPKLIEEVKIAGHEIGYHTHTHQLIYNSSILEKELSDSAEFIAHFHPKGFQAPQIIFPSSGYTVLKDAGFEYSSSIYYPNSEAAIFDRIVEIPVSTFKFTGTSKMLSKPEIRNMIVCLRAKEIPFGSGYFIAILGRRGTSYFINKYEKKGIPAVMFIHNWQIFPPRNSSLRSLDYLLRHPFYIPYALDCRRTFIYLLRNFQFGRLSTLYSPAVNGGIEKCACS